MPARRLLSASTLIGDPLVSGSGEKIGRIEELFISPGGRISLVAVAPLEVPASGKLIVVPWEALTFDSRREQIILQFDQKRLADAPAFDPDRWPDVADQSWVDGIHAFYGTRPGEALHGID